VDPRARGELAGAGQDRAGAVTLVATHEPAPAAGAAVLVHRVAIGKAFDGEFTAIGAFTAVLPLGPLAAVGARRTIRPIRTRSTRGPIATGAVGTLAALGAGRTLGARTAVGAVSTARFSAFLAGGLRAGRLLLGAVPRAATPPPPPPPPPTTRVVRPTGGQLSPFVRHQTSSWPPDQDGVVSWM
jgi:hypothetical protein